jgi:hypothetical protein
MKSTKESREAYFAKRKADDSKARKAQLAKLLEEKRNSKEYKEMKAKGEKYRKMKSEGHFKVKMRYD